MYPTSYFRLWTCLGFLLVCKHVRGVPQTYWVDQSCTDRPEWDEGIITDALRMVSSMYERNELEGADWPFEASFEYTLNTPPDDATRYTLPGGLTGTPFEIVEQVSGNITEITKANDRDPSNIRIYCDLDPMVSASDPNARWKLVADRDNDPGGPNSQRTLGVNQEWFDQVNFVRRGVDTLGCQSVVEESVDGSPFMETFPDSIHNLAGYNAPANLPLYRTVISLCESVFDRTSYTRTTYEQVPQNLDFAQVPNGLDNPYFYYPISTTFAHELRHAAPWSLRDAAGPYSYGWGNVVQMTTATSLDNADSHKYLDILCELEGRHWRLVDDVADAKAGVLVYDPSIS